ncbi:MAG: ATP-dependent RNA helicase DbpA [Pseudomonadales bacterium]
MSAEQDFASLDLSPAQLKNLSELGYLSMTPIQAESLPLMLAGQDLIGQARTGSGKTCAFALGLLRSIDVSSNQVQALVVCPTRELAEQVTQEIRRLARALPNLKCLTLTGGKPLGPQKNSLQHGVHVVVGTPGRLLDHIERTTLDLKELKTLVLDEADRMLDMGFLPDVTTIARAAPGNRQTLLFSATYPPEIQQISRKLQRNPAMVTADIAAQGEAIQQLFFEVSKHERHGTLLAIFAHYQLTSALVFCHTKVQCNQVASLLNDHKIQARALHGDFEQRERDQILIQFSNDSCPVLVATDVAARGLDIKALPAVINYELPRDPEVYVHRVGRTGRAGESGQAFSIFTEAEASRVKAIEAFTGEPCLRDVYASLDQNPDYRLFAAMTTVEINAGRKNKIRPGDVLGALTKDAGLDGADIGKINIGETNCYVAIARAAAPQALNYLARGRIKARSVKARIVK